MLLPGFVLCIVHEEYRVFRCLITESEIKCSRFFFFAVALRPNAGHGLLILEVFLDHAQRRTTIGRTPLDE